MKKNILIVSQTNIIAGAEIVLIDYLIENNEFEFLFYTNKIMSEYIENRLGLFKGEVSKTAYATTSYIKFIYRLVANAIKINNLVKKEKIDIIYANNTYDIILACLYRFLFFSKVKIVSHVHDIIDNRKSRYIFSTFEKYIDKIIVPSNATKDSVLKNIKDKNKVETVYNSVKINCEEFNQVDSLPKKAFYKIGFVGRIVDIKRVDLFVDILKELQNIRDDISGVIVGEVVDKEIFNNISMKIQRENIKCDYLGILSKDSIESLYKQIDLLVLTSDRDPLPTVILEAMSLGTLVLARDVDGVNEIITKEIDGFIFDYDENAKCVAEKIDKILKLSKDERENIINKSKKKIKTKFSRENKQKLLNEILNKV